MQSIAAVRSQATCVRAVKAHQRAHKCTGYSATTGCKVGRTQPALTVPLVTPQRAFSRSVTRLQCEAAEGTPVFEGMVVAAAEHEFGIVVARFNDLVTGRLLEGALATFKRHGVDPKNVTVAWVPGSFELPLVAKSMAKSGRFAAVVGIGAVIRGATTHYDAVVNGATSGLLGASVSTGVPVVFGVLTCDTMEQALDRAGGKVGNKGGEAALTAIEMANLMNELRETGRAAPAWIE